ncbi:hypothetical protein [Klebsiella pneumoniae IS46]|nr:hypothetical protein CSC13_3300 [Klebsiella pneumoniae]QBF20762.1 Hypothetical protein KpB31_2231 [Klebsiella pneumoniae]BBE61097.1 hypothetical protein TRKP064_2003 [Klebsiella pneumoniae]BBE66688.1 hypothetical protein TRKP067_2003 [Klebsiella pneumoniae]CDL13859.1 hypothetical protein [Klebsiella pneumoniae IS46]
MQLSNFHSVKKVSEAYFSRVQPSEYILYAANFPAYALHLKDIKLK